MELLIVMIFLIVAIGGIPFVQGIRRGFHAGQKPVSPQQSKSYTLQPTHPRDVWPTTKPTTRTMTFRDERDLAAARRRVWIRYEDYNGNESERKIEVYCPKEDDNYIFAWCCLKQAPRTFNRNNILAWQVLAEHFDFDPLVERYFQEEGQRDREDKIPWHRWKERH